MKPKHYTQEPTACTVHTIHRVYHPLPLLRIVLTLHPQPSLYLAGPRLFDHADPALVSYYLANLTPEGARLKMISSQFKGKTNKVARYYGTNYNKKSLASQTKAWNNVKCSSYLDLAYPKPNELIPTDFSLVSKPPAGLSQDEKDKLLKAPPTCIRRADKWTIWHKVDK